MRMARIARLFHMLGFPKYDHICDRIWENPPCGINVQCASLVHQVKNCQSPDFVTCQTNTSNRYRRLWRLIVQSTQSVQLLCMEPIAKGVDQNSGYLVLNIDSPFQLLRHRGRSGSLLTTKFQPSLTFGVHLTVFGRDESCYVQETSVFPGPMTWTLRCQGPKKPHRA